MRRAKMGDVFAVKVPNGYKLIQWAYAIGKYGAFVRVFDGLHPEIPNSIQQIIEGPHGYIANLVVGRAYRIGLLEWLGNYKVPDQYPFPEYAISFWANQKGAIFCIDIYKTSTVSGYPRSLTFQVSSITELPEQYQTVKLLHTRVPPDMLLYLFDNDFTLNKLSIFFPEYHWGEAWHARYQVYIDIVTEALSRDPGSKNLLNYYLQDT